MSNFYASLVGGALYNPPIIHSCNMFDFSTHTSIVCSVLEHMLLFLLEGHCAGKEKITSEGYN